MGWVAWLLLAWFVVGFGVALIVGELLHDRTMARDGLQLHLPRQGASRRR